MVDFRAELAALVAAYDEHGGKWPQHHEEALWQAVERARDVLNKPGAIEFWHVPRALSDKALRLLTSLPMDEIEQRLRGPAPAADGEVAELAAWLTKEMPPGTYIGDPTWWASRIAGRAHILMKRQALRPIPVSERLPGPEDCAGAGDCWWYSSFMDDSAWITGDVEYGKRHRFRYWLPAHALPLPEVQ